MSEPTEVSLAALGGFVLGGLLADAFTEIARPVRPRRCVGSLLHRMARTRTLRGRPLPPRVRIVQAELDRFPRPRYLEIGVNVGALFLNVRAAQKVGVDPAPRIPRWRWMLHPNAVARGRIANCTSDRFFAELAADARFDVVFVDGLHTFEQSLRDVNAALGHLASGGVVLAHDCNPTSASLAASAPEPGVEDGWCGDVWKTVVHLRATRRDLRVEVFDTDFGIGVIRRGPSPAPSGIPVRLEEMTYDDLDARRSELLGLTSLRSKAP